MGQCLQECWTRFYQQTAELSQWNTDFWFIDWLWIYKVMQDNRSTVCRTWKSGKFQVMPARCQFIPVFQKPTNKHRLEISCFACWFSKTLQGGETSQQASHLYQRLQASRVHPIVWPTRIGDSAPAYRRRQSVWASASLSRRRLEPRVWPGCHAWSICRASPVFSVPSSSCLMSRRRINRQQRS